MIIDSKKFNAPCDCGREHIMLTKAAIIETGALLRFDKYLADYGLTGKYCAVYDANTYAATADRHPRAAQEIVLDPVPHHADEHAAECVLSQLHRDVELLVAVGSGAIHDTVRYCAHQNGLPFVSVPTAASVDGFCSTVAAMTWYGFKTTLPAVAPELVVADIAIIKNAPDELFRSGVGDILAKYIALADWEISNVLTDEYLCPRIYRLTKTALEKAVFIIPELCRKDDSAYAELIYALLMSGLAMQMMGNSRPASGAEHHISHLVEMEPSGLPVSFEARHGEKTGIGAVLAAAEYHRLAEIEDIAPYVKPYRPVSKDFVRSFFGPALADAVLKENAKDCLAAVSPDRLIKRWPLVRQIIDKIPDARRLSAMLSILDAKRTVAELGVPADSLSTLLDCSPYVRNRLTLMRVRRMLDV